MPLTAEQVRATIAGLNAKTITPIPKSLRDIADKTSYYIWNVGPDNWIQRMGSLGTFTIQAADPETGISPPLKIPGMVFEAVTIDVGRQEQRPWDGREVADDIIGVGRFKDKQQDLTRWGVFISAGPVPTEQEIEDANMKLLERYKELVQEADSFESQGPNQLVNITSRHRLAAKMLNVERDWCKVTRAMIDCPGCGDKILPTVAMHRACGAIIDRKRAEELGMIEKKKTKE
jgi:hypothetical protein